MNDPLLRMTTSRDADHSPVQKTVKQRARYIYRKLRDVDFSYESWTILDFTIGIEGL